MNRLGLIGCDEWNVLKDRLDLLVTQAEQLGITGTDAYIAAKRYYDDNTGFFSRPAVLIGSACTTEVNEINSRINGLTAEIAKHAAPVVNDPPVAPGENPFDTLSNSLKWVVGGAIAISLAVVVSTVLPRVMGRKRSYSGYKRRRRHRS